MAQSKAQRWLYFASLVLAAESIYMLPYLRKTFQTSMEVSFGLGSVELGLLNSMYGLVALAAYFPGGWLADRVSARRLLAFSLFSTGLGGLYMASIPPHTGLVLLHAFWGLTSILTFWAALIKAVRDWGGATQQGIGFGLFEAGRGVVAALLASLATLVFAYGGSPTEGLVNVIICYSMATFVAGALVWFLVPEELHDASARAIRSNGSAETQPAHWREILTKSRSWLLASVIFCAYFLYLGTYDFPAYAERGFEQTKLLGAQLATFRDWMRPLAAISAGLIADRLNPSRVVGVSFCLLLIVYVSLALMPSDAGYLWFFWAQVAIAALAGFALRAVFYALLQETGVPLSQTGMTVGFVSVIGYAPDLFAHTLAGHFADWFGVDMGYRYYFAFLSVFACLGLLATWKLVRKQRLNSRSGDSQIHR